VQAATSCVGHHKVRKRILRKRTTDSGICNKGWVRPRLIPYIIGAVGPRYGATPANGARCEDTRVDRRTAYCGVARGSANVTNTTANRCKRPEKQFATPKHRRYLPGGNNRDVLQRTHRPEQRGLWDAWRCCSQHGDYHAFSGHPDLWTRFSTC
jgi:hypothetical protein